MVEMRKPISVSKAVSRTLSEVKILKAESISIDECDGRILADDILADHDVPPFDRSPYDGFAIHANHTEGASRDKRAEFKVVAKIAAGEIAEQALNIGEAMRIMTGAPIPEGADAVVMLEHVEEINKNSQAFIRIEDEYVSGQNISRKGEDTQKGTVQVKKGTKITPGVKAVLATFGYAKVKVTRRPVVGIYATGTELLDVSDSILPGKIRNSNAYTIISQVREAGGEPRYFGQLVDDFDTCFTAVKESLSKVDVLITTGGASVGDYDYLQEIFQKLEAEICFNKVAMRPGSVTTIAKWQDKTMFALSGNPASCFVGFELFTRPLLKMMMGARNPFLLKATALLEKDFSKPNPYTRFTRAKVTFKDGKLYAGAVGLDKSNAVTPLAHINAFIVLPGGTKGYEKETEVDVLLLNGEDEQWTIT